MASNVAPSSSATSTISNATACAGIPEENYGSLSINGSPIDRPAVIHPDLNLGIRGYRPVVAFTGLIDLDGATASEAPQLVGLFGDRRLPNSRGVFAVYDWDWSTNTRGGPINDPPVTMVSVGVSPGETIHVPDAGTNIGLGYAALVLYAAPTRITLKYTGEDGVEAGYTLHLENLCVEPRLLALYQNLDGNGRGQLPAVRAGQAIGRAAADQLGIAIRDSGAFLDPRSRKDWWRGH